MKVPTHEEAFQVLLLQAADDGRAELLFGDSLERLREAIPPFLIGDDFPDVYLEHPLIGSPFIDATVLYGKLRPGLHVDSPLAGKNNELFDWFSEVRESYDDISFGFELDTKEEVPPAAAVHFQPRRHTELVRPFCELADEPERASLFLDFAKRLPDDWSPSFFGLFRGRAGSPLRICGYVDVAEKLACATDHTHLAHLFDTIGFAAYHEEMLAQISAIMAAAPSTVDFQFDVYPDGSLGSMFALDVRFGVQQPEEMQETFENGPGARLMGILEGWGMADDRWRLATRAAFARAIPAVLPDNSIELYAFTLMPQWVKVRWVDGKLQPSKLYHLGRGALLGRSKA